MMDNTVRTRRRAAIREIAERNTTERFYLTGTTQAVLDIDRLLEIISPLLEFTEAVADGRIRHVNPHAHAALNGTGQYQRV
jgi:hypothetical protein